MVVELDGGYHKSSKHQSSKRKPRDETLKVHYGSNLEIYHFDVEDIYNIEHGYSDHDLRQIMSLV